MAILLGSIYLSIILWDKLRETCLSIGCPIETMEEAIFTMREEWPYRKAKDLSFECCAGATPGNHRSESSSSAIKIFNTSQVKLKSV